MFLAAAVLLPALWMAGGEPPARDTATESKADSVRVAVLRYHLEAQEAARSAAGLRDRLTFYLTVKGGDPSESLLNRFRNGRSRLRPASAWKPNGARRGLDFSALAWETPERVKVWFATENGLEGTSQKIVVELKNGAWTVVGIEGGVISS